jgi:hypothetical protein
MSCDCTFNHPVTTRTFTGRSETHVACDVSNYPDLKHWVTVKNIGGYAMEIGVSAEINSDHRIVRFRHCPQFPLPASSGVQDHSWNSKITLNNGEDHTFAVFLRSDVPNGNPQDIDIEVVTTRFHPRPDPPQQSRVTIKVTA